MFDTNQVREWNDVYVQMAALHERDTKMFDVALVNFARVFQRKLDRFGNQLIKFGNEMELRHRQVNEAQPRTTLF